MFAGVGEKAQLAMHLPCKHRNLSWDPKNPRKNRVTAECFCNPGVTDMVMGRFIGVCWLVSLDRSINSGFGEKPCLKKIRRMATEEATQC